MVISLLNQKGGVGKTTTAINLAYFLADAGKRVLVVDFDPQGNATSGLGIDKHTIESGSYELLSSGMNMAMVQETEFDNLKIICSNTSLAGAELFLTSQDNREYVLKNTLNTDGYDFVLIDCPPSLGLLTINALVASDYVLIPVQAEYYALEGLSQLVSVMQRVKGSFNSNLAILGLVLTMYDSRTSLSEQVKKEVEKHFGEVVFKTVIPRNIRLAEAPSHGKPIAIYDRWSKGTKAYKQLTKEVLSRVEQ